MDIARITREKTLLPEILLLAFLTAVFFHKVLFFGMSFSDLDIAIEHYPIKKFIAESLGNGVMPLWMPEIFFGFPIFAAAQQAVLYPLNLLLLPLGPDTQINLSIIIHFFMSGVFMLMFLGTIIKERRAVFLGAVMWMFSALFAYKVGHMSVILEISYIPLFFYLAEKAAGTGKIIYLSLITPLVFLSVLIGQLQTPVYMYLLLVPYFVVRVMQYGRRARDAAAGAGVLVLFSLLGAAMASVQLLPSMELTSFSTRAQGLDMAAVAGSEKLSLLNIINLLFPYAFGSVHANTYIGQKIAGAWSQSYMGIYAGAASFAVILLFIAVKIRDKTVMLFGALAVFAFIFAFGPDFPPNRLLLSLPGLSLFKNPMRMTEMFVFFAVSLTAYLAAGAKPGDVPVRVLKILLVIAAVSAVSALVMFMLKPVVFSHFNAAIEKVIRESLMKGMYHYRPFEYYYDKLANTYSHIFSHAFVQMLFVSAAGVVILVFSKQKITKNVFLMLLVMLAVTDLFVNFMNFPCVTKKSYYSYMPRTAEYIKSKDDGLYRIFSWRHFEHDSFAFLNGRHLSPPEGYMKSAEILQTNCHAQYGLHGYWGYDPLVFNKYNIFADEMIKGELTGGSGAAEWFRKGRKTLDISGVKYIFSYAPLGEAGLTYLSEQNGVYIYENKNAAQMIRFVSKAVFMDDESEIANAIKAGVYDFTKETVIKGKDMSDNTGAKGSVTEVIKWGRDITFTMETDGPGYVVIANSYYPGWRAYSGGAELEILNADYMFQAVKIENAGSHEISLKYDPGTFKTGVMVSVIAAFVFLLLLAAGMKIRYFYK